MMLNIPTAIVRDAKRDEHDSLPRDSQRNYVEERLSSFQLSPCECNYGTPMTRINTMYLESKMAPFVRSVTDKSFYFNFGKSPAVVLTTDVVCAPAISAVSLPWDKGTCPTSPSSTKSDFCGAFRKASAMMAASAPENGTLSMAQQLWNIDDAASGDT